MADEPVSLEEKVPLERGPADGAHQTPQVVVLAHRAHALVGQDRLAARAARFRLLRRRLPATAYVVSRSAFSSLQLGYAYDG